MGTKLTELRAGCFARALDDEPMFVLLARDESAPGNVDAWADNREADVHAQRRPSSDLEVIAEARHCARQMRAWRKANDGKWRTGLFANTLPDPIMPELRDKGIEPFVSFGKAATELVGRIAPNYRPRTGDAAYDFENDEAEGGVLRAAVHDASELMGDDEQRAKSSASNVQRRYGLTDAKRDAIASDIAACLRGDEDALIRAGMGSYASVFDMLPWYVWAVLLFAAGVIVSGIAHRL